MSPEHGAWEPYERALEAAYRGGAEALVVRSDVGEEERVDPAMFFRQEDEFERWERLALGRAAGRVLDVGAGAGPHALALQARGLQVAAIDALPGAVRIMRERGVMDARLGDYFSLPSGRWDTLVYLMNGTMPFGTLDGLQEGLSHALTRVMASGRLLIDSTDLRNPGGLAELEDGRYVGEAHYGFEYDGQAGPLISQLFVDPERLFEAARSSGWLGEVVWADGEGHYLAELVPCPVTSGPDDP